MSAPGNFCKSGLQGPLGETRRTWPTRVLALSAAALALALHASAGQAQRISLTDLNAQLNALELRAEALRASGGIEPGTIVLWSGDLGNIPEGWALCDGNRGTPDLQDRFVVGPYKTLGTVFQGGSFRHQHPQQHDHSNVHDHGLADVRTNMAGEHDHTLGGDVSTIPGPCCGPGKWSAFVVAGPDFDGHGHRLQTAFGGHSHWLEGVNGDPPRTFFNAQQAISEAMLESVGNHPPFYTLAFIMKLPVL